MKNVIGILLSLVVLLSGAVLILFLRPVGVSNAEVLEAAIDDPDVRREALQELMKRSGGVWDSYLDPDVGRILLPKLEDRWLRGVQVLSNELGMREGYYSVRKPDNVIRVVLLGDSYVFGSGIDAEERIGVALRTGLLEGRKTERPIEVLHIGLTSWNIIAECAYLRRQLDELDPDLVVHLTIFNDLEDLAGVRGFGEMAGFSPQVRQRGSSRIGQIVPREYSSRSHEHALPAGLDWESRTRYDRARQDIERLAELLAERGADYLHVFQWNQYNAVAQEHLASNLPPEQQLFVSREFHFDPDNWITPHDRHWNLHGNERIAKMLYAAIQQRGMLPELELKPMKEADAELVAIHERALVELEEELAPPPYRTRLTCPPEDEAMGTQVYVGLTAEGYATNYVSFVLANDGAGELVVDGESLGRPELRGKYAKVYVEEFLVGRLDLGPGAGYPRTLALPVELAERAFLNVRFESEDWVYRQVFCGLGMSFRLKSATLR